MRLNRVYNCLFLPQIWKELKHFRILDGKLDFQGSQSVFFAWKRWVVYCGMKAMSPSSMAQCLPVDDNAGAVAVDELGLIVMIVTERAYSSIGSIMEGDGQGDVAIRWRPPST